MQVEYKVFKRKVKYLRLEIRNGILRLIIPENINIEPERIIEKHKNWIERKFELLNEIKELSKNCKIYSHENLEEIVLRYVKEIGKILKVKPSAISFRWMKRRWGSCTSKNKLIFNKLLKYLPEELIRYVVIHEMCHLLIKNHKKEFWLLVKKLEPRFLHSQKLLASYKIELSL
jgi:predicted metal-dependent hydrolase